MMPLIMALDIIPAPMKPSLGFAAGMVRIWGGWGKEQRSLEIRRVVFSLQFLRRTAASV